MTQTFFAACIRIRRVIRLMHNDDSLKMSKSRGQVMVLASKRRGRIPEDEAKWWIGLGLDQDGFSRKKIDEKIVIWKWRRKMWKWRRKMWKWRIMLLLTLTVLMVQLMAVNQSPTVICQQYFQFYLAKLSSERKLDHSKSTPVPGPINITKKVTVNHTNVSGITMSNLSKSLSNTKAAVTHPDDDASGAMKMPTKKKPGRYCRYCKSIIGGGKLKRHLMRRHRDQAEVQELRSANPKTQNLLFSKIRVQGMHMFNQLQMQEKKFEQSQLMRERIPKTDDSLRYCTQCGKYISNKYFFHHKTSCENAVPLKLVLLGVKQLHNDTEFEEGVLSKFREGTLGDLCRNDNTIKLMGYRHFCLRRAEDSKRQEVRKCVMTEMRELAHIYIQFKELCPASTCVQDMFSREHLTQLLDAIDIHVKKENDEKSGLKLLLNTIIQKSIKTLRGYFNSEKLDDQAAELEKFHQAYNFHVPERFATARHKTMKASMQNARRPQALPEKEDLRRLQAYAMGEIQYLEENFEISKMTWFRSLLVAVITLWNFRRGEEGSRITLEEWTDAVNDVWLPKEQVENVNDEAEKYLIGKYKLLYLHGKGDKRYVPCLIPKKLMKALGILVEHRKEFGICEDNIFLFATKGGQGHASGWHAVTQVGAQIGVKVTATQNRHYISTVYAGFEMSPKDREIFYSHMGHEENVNRQNYQCPHGLQELKIMGRVLDNYDESNTKGVAAADVEAIATADVEAIAAAADVEAIAGAVDDEPGNRKKQKSVSWSKEDSQILEKHFAGFFADLDGPGNTGPLPGKSDIIKFIDLTNLTCLQGLSHTMKYQKIRAKLFNERKTRRAMLKKI